MLKIEFSLWALTDLDRAFWLTKFECPGIGPSIVAQVVLRAENDEDACRDYLESPNDRLSSTVTVYSGYRIRATRLMRILGNRYRLRLLPTRVTSIYNNNGNQGPPGVSLFVRFHSLLENDTISDIEMK
jgi:hypothetical protein